MSYILQLYQSNLMLKYIQMLIVIIVLFLWGKYVPYVYVFLVEVTAEKDIHRSKIGLNIGYPLVPKSMWLPLLGRRIA